MCSPIISCAQRRSASLDLYVRTKRVSRSEVPVCVFVSDQLEDSDQTKVVVGVVVGLLVAALVIGLAYWLYVKRSK